MTLFLIALGGALGSVLRHLAVTLLGAPWATAAVNVTGSFLIGLAFVLLASRASAPFVMTGVLGGFTTFSAFSLDTLKLVQAGHLTQAGLYVLASVALSLLAVTAGVTLGRAL